MASVSRKVRKLATALIMVLAMVAGMLGGVATAHADSQVTSVPTENSTGEGDPSTPPVNKPEPSTTEGSTTSDNQTTTPQPGKTEQAPTNPDQSSTSKDSSSPSVRSIELRTVTFDTNGAFTPTPPAQTIQNNMFPARPSTDPMRTGYHFDGWINGDTNYDFATPVTADLTLTAHWTRASGEWGLNPNYGPAAGGTKVTLIPPQVSDSSQISAGRKHTIVLASDGNAYAWGRNDYGELGDGTKCYYKSGPVKIQKPKSVPSDFRFTQVSAGYEHSVAIGSDGNAYAWGNNGDGQLGIGPSRFWDTKKVPVKVLLPKGVSNDFKYTQISAGYHTTLAIGSDGKAYAWGWHEHGSLGTGNHRNQSRATQIVPPADTNPDFRFTDIIAGEQSSFALGSDGNAYAWGDNGSGQLGDGTTSTRWTPVRVKKPSSLPGFTYTQISCIYGSTLALGSDGNAYGWGANESGQLGNKSTHASRLPVEVLKPSTASNDFRYVKISAGHSHALAIGSDGKAYAWGGNQYKQLGDGSKTSRNRPAKLNNPSGVASDFKYTQLCAGISDSVAVGSNGDVFYWGRINMSGSQYLANPVKVRVPDVSSGSTGIIKVNSVKFDGTNSLTAPADNGDGTWLVTSPSHAAGVVDVSVDWTLNGYPSTSHLSYRYEETFYTVTFDTADGRPVTTQQIKERDYVARPSPDPTRKGWLFDGWFLGTSNVAYDFSQPVTGNLTLTAHWSYTGYSGKGVKGRMRGSSGPVRMDHDRNSKWSMIPTSGPESGGNTVRLLPPDHRGIRFSSTSIGDHHAVAVGSDGNVYAWGSNDFGQLGNGTKEDSAKPSVAKKPAGKDDGGFSYLTAKAGEDFTIALGSDRKVYAWGNGRYGQLGNFNHQQESLVPVQVLTPENMTFQAIDAGATHALAVARGGKEIYGWGNAQYGRLGNGDNENNGQPVYRSDPNPTRITLDYDETVSYISAGSWHSVYLTSKGRAFAFGSSNYGQLGLGNLNNQRYPVEVPKPNLDPGCSFTDVSAGGSHTLFVCSDGDVYGVGMNSYGQLGTGVLSDKELTLTKMRKPHDATNIKYTNVSAGGFHSLVASDKGYLYGCGYNSLGQLGNNSNDYTTTEPTKVLQPANEAEDFQYKTEFDAGSGATTVSVALGQDGYVYSFGTNQFHALGNDLVTDYAKRPVRVMFPELGTLTEVFFDDSPGIIVNQNRDESWNVIVPEHNQGGVQVTVRWSLSKVQQSDQLLTYTYLHVGSLPNAGGSGILLVLLAGFLVMGGTIVIRRYRTSKMVGPNPAKG